MKKIGQIYESRMVKAVEPTFYPLVSDTLFENAVKGRRKTVKKEDAGIGVLNSPGDPLKREQEKGTKPNPKPPTSRNLPEPSAKDKFTNPFVNDSKKVGKARLRKEAESGEFQGQMDPHPRPGKRGGLPPRGSTYRGAAPKTKHRSPEEIAKLNKPKEGKMSDLDIKSQEGDPKAKARLKKIEKVKTENDKERKPKRAMFKANAYTTKIKSKGVTTEDKWIQGANADIKRRGTKGKCTPITNPGCTGKAKALAKTFKKMARKKDRQTKAKDEK